MILNLSKVYPCAIFAFSKMQSTSSHRNGILVCSLALVSWWQSQLAIGWRLTRGWRGREGCWCRAEAMGCCSHKELGTVTTWWEKNCSSFSHDFWIQITDNCHQAILLNSHGFTFADSREHYKPEDSPEGAWGTESHHGRADLQLRHESRIPPPPQSWSHQWKFASAHWKGQVSSRMLFRWSGIGLLAEIAVFKCKPSNTWEFSCFHSLFVFNVMNHLGSQRARRKLSNGSEHLLNSWKSILASAQDLQQGFSTVWWVDNVHLDVRMKGQGTVFRNRLQTFPRGQEQEKHGLSNYCFAAGQKIRRTIRFSLWWCHCSELDLSVLHLLLCKLAFPKIWQLFTDFLEQCLHPSVIEVNEVSVKKSSGQWREGYLLEGIFEVDLSTKKKVRLLYKWLCVISGIVALFSSLSLICHATFKLFLFHCGPSVTCFCLLCGKQLSTVQFFFTRNSRIVVERVHIWIFSCAVHTLLFRKKATPPPDPRLQPESCLLLQPTPTRGGQKARVSSRTNTYILVDSGLRVRSPQIKKLHIQNFVKSMQRKVFWIYCFNSTAISLNLTLYIVTPVGPLREL